MLKYCKVLRFFNKLRKEKNLRYREFLSNLYFNSLEDREKIFARLQFNIAISIVPCAPVVYMLRMMDFECNLFSLVFVYTGIFFWFLSFLETIDVISKSITGFEYKYFCDPLSIKKYREAIDSDANEIKMYNLEKNEKNDFLNSEDEIEKLKNDCLEEIVSHNLKVNEKRRDGTRIAIGIFLKQGLLPIFIAGAIFIYCDLDTSSPRKNILIQDTNLAKEINNLGLRIDALQTNQRLIEMTKEDDSKKSNLSSPAERPKPTIPQQLPPKPEIQISLESFDRIPTPGATILNEQGKK